MNVATVYYPKKILIINFKINNETKHLRGEVHEEDYFFSYGLYVFSQSIALRIACKEQCK